MKDKLTHIEEGHVDIENRKDIPELGQWGWVTSKNHKDEIIRWFACVIKIGSNYILVDQPSTGGYYEGLNSYSTRIHFKELEESFELVEDPQPVLDGFINQYKQEGDGYLTEIKEITLRLGLKTGHMLENRPSATGNEVALFNQQNNVDDYKLSLIKAQKEDLPVLFKKLEKAQAGLKQWMSSPLLSLKNNINELKGSINEIEGRLFNVTLYAGLDENLIKVKEGNPAEITERLHIMQRKLYMDEECLLDYDAGGMKFEDIESFDAWLSKEENLNRVLPYERTLVAMQVRRHKNQRIDSVAGYYRFIAFSIKDADKYTFLYIRNGQQLWRLSINSFNFDETIFPDRSEFDPSEPMMFRLDPGETVSQFMTEAEFNIIKAEHDEKERKAKEWELANPDEKYWNNPFRSHSSSEVNSWRKLNTDSVYFDEAVSALQSKIVKYNRISIIVQGLFDRSLSLAPHLPVKTWEADSFNKTIKLVYDAENTLYAGEKPDFEAYRAKCNAEITTDSVLAGQEEYWMKKEAEKENLRNDRNYSHRGHTYPHYTHYKPSGNPGMGPVAKPSSINRKKATFKWKRQSRKGGWYGSDELIDCLISVPLTELLNVSAYQKDDYKQFFKDPRTRAEYLKWAPLLLSAEDYLANGIPEPDQFKDWYAT